MQFGKQNIDIRISGKNTGDKNMLMIKYCIPVRNLIIREQIIQILLPH